MKVIDINPYTVLKTGFFCKRGKKDCEGYQKKLKWLEARFAEGMRIKMLNPSEGGRGFIEYIPGEYAWRPVYAEGYMFIHCLWVAGESKGKGYASQLLEDCLTDASHRGMNGLAMVTSESDWLVSKRFLFGEGFESMDQAPPTFELLVNRFNRAPAPSFPKNWDERLRRLGDGLTIVRTDQCPYVDEGAQAALDAAKELGLRTRVVELKSCREVREYAPSPYGVFSIVLNGRLLSYHYLSKKDLLPRMQEALRFENSMRRPRRKSRAAASPAKPRRRRQSPSPRKK